MAGDLSTQIQGGNQMRAWVMLAGVLAMAAALLVAAPLGSAQRGDDGAATRVAAAIAAVPTIAVVTRVAQLEVIGLTADARLICFETDEPEDARTIGALTRLMGDTRLVGIDYRPNGGALYGVGNAGSVYTINDDTAAGPRWDS